jgi:hypothetical protein
MSKVTRCAATGALMVVLISQGTVAASAASPDASCVGIIVSTQAPAGEFEVGTYKALADSFGLPTFGQFVSVGAKLHEGTFEECLP